MEMNGRPRFRPTHERPCRKLSSGLLSTYKHINELFYEAKRLKQTERAAEKESCVGCDDENGNYIVQVGEEISGRYIVQECLGKGSFGVVVKARDQRRDELVAIKIIKNKVQFFHQAKVEIEILSKLNAEASEDQNIVKLKKVFSWKEHLCLVFELLSFNLYDLLKYTKFNGVSLNLIRKFAYQILKTLDFLSSSQVGVIHCDLKPENILLKNPKRSGIKVIDFGSSCFTTKRMFKYIQSRFYRSPEVILGLQYDCAIDIWSLGCILVEMHTGQPIFDGKDEAEQMIKFTNILSAPPQRMVEQSPKRKNFYQWDGKLKRWILAPPNRDPAKYPKSTLEEIIGIYSGGPGGRRKGQPGHTELDYLNFLDLVKKMFVYSAASRITPQAALQHPFLSALNETQASPSRALASPVRYPSPSYTSANQEKEQRQRGSQRDTEGTWCSPREPERRESRNSNAVPGTGTRSAGGSDHLSLLSRDRRSSVTSAAGVTGTTAYGGVVPPVHSSINILPRSGAPSPRSISMASSSPLRAHSFIGSPTNPNLGRTRSGSHLTGYTQSSPHVRDVPINPHGWGSSEQGDHYTFSPPQSSTSPLRLKPKQPGGTAVECTPVTSPRSYGLLSPNSGDRTTPLTTMKARSASSSLRFANGTPTSPHSTGAELRQIASTIMSPDRKYPSPQTDGRKWLPSPTASDSFRKIGEGKRTSPTSSIISSTSGKGHMESERPLKFLDNHYGDGYGVDATRSWRYPIAEQPRLVAVSSHHHGGAEPMHHIIADR